MSIPKYVICLRPLSDICVLDVGWLCSYILFHSNTTWLGTSRSRVRTHARQHA